MSYICPFCGSISHKPSDEFERYCGKCHKFESREEERSRVSLEEVTTQVARALKDLMPPGMGYALLMFDMGQGGNIAYASTGEREDMIKAMRELLGKLEKDKR